MEWKKAKFMESRVGEDFDGLIIGVTKFGFFVELTDLFVEGLVPLATLIDDHYTYHENTREIIGRRSRKTYRLGREFPRYCGPDRSGGKENSIRIVGRRGVELYKSLKPGRHEQEKESRR